MSRPEISIGIDSQCLSYLIDSMTRVCEPKGPLRREKIALIRTWFYFCEVYFVSEKVDAECKEIRNTDLREMHESFLSTIIAGLPIRDSDFVERRTAELMASHSGEADCRILAEAEDLELDVLLSYDFNFISRLAGRSDNVQVIMPSKYWNSLEVARGARPRVVPHSTNPLHGQTWWRW